MPDTNDFLGLDADLDDENTLVRKTVRQFVEQQWMPVVVEHFEAGTFPTDLIRPIADMGLLGMHLEGYGCAGASALAYGLACRELERGDSGLRSFVSVQGSLCMFPIWRYGSEDQKHEWLPGMARGEIIGCFGLTEPDSGSDPGAMKTVGRRHRDSWVIDGAKRWITNAPIADLAIIWARTEDGIAGFVVPTDGPGVEIRSIERKLSLRASTTGEIYLDAVRVGDDHRLPGALGLSSPLSCLAEARFGIAFGALGAAASCFETVVAYTTGRSQFGKPLAGHQIVQLRLAEMLTGITTGTLMAFRLAQLKEAGRLDPVQISMAKRHNVRVALDAARSARALLGANGISLDYPVIRHMTNLESVLTYEGTEEVHALVLGEAVTGISAFR